MKNKKGMSVGSLLPLGITFVILGIAFAVGSSVLSTTAADFVTGAASCGANATGGSGGTILYTHCGAAYNATQDSLTGIGTFSGWLDTIALVLVASVIIGILVVYLARKFA